MPDITNPSPADKREVLKALAWARGELWATNHIHGSHTAIAPLFEWARKHAIPDHEAFAIIVNGFRKGIYGPPPPLTPEWTQAAAEWRAERNRDDPISRKPPPGPPPKNCETCTPGPCRFPTFCALTEQANQWWATLPDNHPLIRGRR